MRVVGGPVTGIHSRVAALSMVSNVDLLKLWWVAAAIIKDCLGALCILRIFHQIKVGSHLQIRDHKIVNTDTCSHVSSECSFDRK
jgi:hypothetical protein